MTRSARRACPASRLTVENGLIRPFNISGNDYIASNRQIERLRLQIVTQHPPGDFREGMPFLGGRLWIDLVNTRSDALGDLVSSPDGWQKWAATAELEPAADAPFEAKEARELRSALARLFDPLIEGNRPPADAIGVINSHLRRAASFPQLSANESRLAFQQIPVEPLSAVGEIAVDFANFIAAGFEPARLRHCSGEACSLVFYDSSRNGARRWCSMEVCGNRHKVKSHRARKTDTE